MTAGLFFSFIFFLLGKVCFLRHKMAVLSVFVLSQFVVEVEKVNIYT